MIVKGAILRLVEVEEEGWGGGEDIRAGRLSACTLSPLPL
jgi:hypothetical protein